MSENVILLASNNMNAKLANAINEEANKQGLSSQIVNLTELDLPLYTPQVHGKDLGENFKNVLSIVNNAKTVTWVAPEYNGGIPPVLNNFIAWVSTSEGADWRVAFNSKPALMATHSGSGGLHALMVLRTQLSYIGMNVLGRQIHTHFKKALNEESLTQTIAALKKQI